MRWMIVATVLLAGCPSPAPQLPRPPDDTALRIRIARAEAKRGGGLAELVELATHGEVHQRALALRGLGRVGALGVPEKSLQDSDLAIVAAAAEAVGIAASLDEPDATELARISNELVAVLPRADRSVVLEALGRAGDAKSQAAITAELVGPPRIAEAAALALGRHGRRKIALVAEARGALVAATSHADSRVRYAAVYALAREHQPPADDAVGAALAARITDDDPEIRAVAIAGLARRNAIAAGRKAIEDSLRDRDWRVAVEAVRALAGEHGDDAGRDAVAAILARRYAELERGHEAEAHVVIEGLRALLAHGDRPLVTDAATALVQASSEHVAPLARGWIQCLAQHVSGRGHGVAVDSLAHCGADHLPDRLRLPLLADVGGDAATRRAALRILLGHADARVRAAGLAELAKDADDPVAIATLAAALGSTDPIIAGAAIDAVEKLPAKELDVAIVARAANETDPELSSSLLALIGKRTIAAGADACRAGLAGHPVRAKAAADCLRALGEPSPPTTIGIATPPPVDVADVIGKHLVWHVVTSRGEIAIELAPELAPWNVATVVALTQRHFYDGLEFHRVVPGFVVQGGDPTMSGYGGPGFSSPAEPGGELTTGGVGMADAGRDSGGSQWFVMHAWMPHLTGRYTYIGHVIAGQNAVDSLQIGDRIERATIEIRRNPM